MRTTAKSVLLTGAMVLALGASANAAAITPVFDTFGPLPGATFGGSGIPNHSVATTTIVDGGLTFVIGLTAHQRLVGPDLENDGAGTFKAPAGFGDPGLSKWNFAYYLDITGTGTPSDYSVELLYDFDPGAGTDAADHGIIDFATGLTGSPLLIQDSQNLAFGFLAVPFPGVITPPSYPAFDPTVTGEYTFSLRVTRISDGALLGESAIAVNTVPEPSSLALLSLGAFGAAGGIRRRKRKIDG